jgi:hypothetical protein
MVVIRMRFLVVDRRAVFLEVLRSSDRAAQYASMQHPCQPQRIPPRSRSKPNSRVSSVVWLNASTNRYTGTCYNNSAPNGIQLQAGHLAFSQSSSVAWFSWNNTPSDPLARSRRQASSIERFSTAPLQNRGRPPPPGSVVDPWNTGQRS